MTSKLDMRFFTDPLRMKLQAFARTKGIVFVGGIYLPFMMAHKLHTALHARMMFITAETIITKERWDNTDAAWKLAGFTGDEIKAFDKTYILEINKPFKGILS